MGELIGAAIFAAGVIVGAWLRARPSRQPVIERVKEAARRLSPSPSNDPSPPPPPRLPETWEETGMVGSGFTKVEKEI